MIKTLAAQTREIDNPRAAADEIVRQIGATCKYSVGILTCYSEFAESGALKAVCDALPFDVIGMTTCASGQFQNRDELILCVTVLTSDDTRFSAFLTDALREDDYEQVISQSYSAAKHALGASPELCVTMLPLFTVSGDRILAAIDSVSGKVPVFGTQAHDIRNFDFSAVIYNGKTYRDNMCALLIGGGETPVSPKFFRVSAFERKLLSRTGRITKSRGNVILEIDDKPFSEYLESLDIPADSLRDALMAVPFMLDCGDFAVPRAVYSLTDEGHALCSCDMPEGATIMPGIVTAQEVQAAAAEMADKVSGLGGCSLLASSLTHYIVLGSDSFAEYDTMARAFAKTGSHFHFCYSSGEICPFEDKNGVIRGNSYYNFSVVCCNFGGLK